MLHGIRIKRRVAQAALAGLLAAAITDAQDSPGPFVGTWSGEARVGEERTPLTLEIALGPNGPTATLDLPEVGARDWPLRNLRVVEGRLHLDTPTDDGISRMELYRDGEELRGEWEVALRPEVAEIRCARREASDTGIAEEVVRFEGDGVTLEGALVLPAGPGPFPAVVHVHGSGDLPRDASRYKAYRLAARGVASLIYDKRGVGASTGSWRDVGFQELAGDAVAAAELLARDERIDATCIGLLGTSQGGWVAPLAASRCDEIDFLITVSGPLVTPAKEGHWDSLFALKSAGYDQEVLDSVDEILDLWDEGLRTGDWSLYVEAREFVLDEPWFAAAGLPGPDPARPMTWYRRIMDFDPEPLFRELDIPVLAILGAQDESIPAEDSAARLQELARELDKPFEVQLYPDANHSLRVVTDASDEFRWPGFVPGYFDRQADFIQRLASARDSLPIDPVLDELGLQAEALELLVESTAARALLAAVAELPSAEPGKIYRASGNYLAPAYTQAEFAELDAAEREGVREVPVDTRLWYHTFYGSPLASIRAFDLAAGHGIDSYEGKRVLDFGFGSIGQLLLLARCGADVVGTEVMPALRALYAGAEDTNPRLVFGRWPAEQDVIDAVGGGFDLFLSKNTIKRGYIDPPVEVAPGYLLDFGVEQEVFLGRLFAALKPGGLAVFYNLGGKPAGPGEAYRPPTDIASPWSRTTYEAVGFEVLALGQDDTEMAREFGFALGWEASMDLETSLFATVTVLRRPR